MIQKDFIMRLIEEAAQVLSIALGLRERGEYIRAVEVVDDAFSGLVGVDWAYLLELKPEEIAERLRQEKQLEPVQIETLAHLLVARGEAMLDLGNELLAKDCLERALSLYRALDAWEPDLLSWDRMNQVSQVRALLARIAPPEAPIP